MTILIISHTEHYINAAGEVCGWGPTVREVDYLADTYGKVIHIACLDKKTPAPRSASRYRSNHVEFVGIPIFGGPSLQDKLKILTLSPTVVRTVFKQLKRADIFQFRSPTAMGTYLIPALTWCSTKKGWFKYAGNWAQKKKPLSYGFQKRFLERYQNRPVTINGRWNGQKKHVHTFENPSLTENDLKSGEACLAKKNYNQALIACFVGRLESAKGVDRIIENLSQLSKKGVTEVHFVGDGDQSKKYKSQTANSSVNCIFHGFSDQSTVFEIYRLSHLLLLPTTASEGFPKVIAEAANFGCIPVVSNVSSIPQYINEKNGFVWDVSAGTFSAFLSEINFDSNLRNKAQSVRVFSELFTFEALSKKLEKHVF
ncbi:MAG: glycosyltransferase involved in cell wall biosynthesis [Roseivirga sp.]|jgi:glycosyltransferase involved in cell wall biosynthesis